MEGDVRFGVLRFGGAFFSLGVLPLFVPEMKRKAVTSRRAPKTAGRRFPFEPGFLLNLRLAHGTIKVALTDVPEICPWP